MIKTGGLKAPTPKGEEYGITAETRIGPKGRYSVLRYGTQAQRYLIDHISEIIEMNNKKHDEKPPVYSENHGMAWDAEQDEQLTKLFRDGLPIEAIATEMKRTVVGICARLVRLGLIDSRGDV